MSVSDRDRRQVRVVGRRIRQERERNCLTLRGLCEAIELASNFQVSVTPAAVCRWESGTHSVALRYRHALADALAIPVERLFERVYFGEGEAA